MNDKPPLGMPSGSVRALMALLIVGSVMIPYAFSALTGTPEKPDPELLVLVSAAAGAYGISRTLSK